LIHSKARFVCKGAASEGEEEDMTIVLNIIRRSKPSLLTQLPQSDRDMIERNAAAARERLRHEKARKLVPAE